MCPVHWNFALLLLSGICYSLTLQCQVTMVDPRRSFRYFKLQVGPVQCFNPGAIQGLTECVGKCDSRGRYTPGNTTILRDCWCCTPTGDPNQVTVELECKDGSRFTRNMAVPKECECKSCEIFDNINTQIPIPT
ncbi:hypothetical protein BIW11_01602 [Tropilaelaps mercedesae]|uniref:CTCK domain-containing protein n=1 Tax=Tropilaelaps mercedesae TaxID=418985 RepID=A0A1V9XBK7_9ACAR|nr:hypothetical protein BIW11_01602 [Tropilaelaps mercedesae]